MQKKYLDKQFFLACVLVTIFICIPVNLQADFKLMCDNAMVYNRPETVYYKAAKKLLHTGFKMMSKVSEIIESDCNFLSFL